MPRSHEAADAFRAAAGHGPGSRCPQAAVAYRVLTAGAWDTVLLGPRDAGELRELLDGARNTPAVVSAGWQRDLAPELLDPSRWGSVRS